MDITGIRKAIATNAKTAEGLSDAKHWRPDLIHAGNAFWVELDRIVRRSFGNTTYTLELTGRLQVQGVWDRSVSEEADELTDLVLTAIESDQTLGNRACSVFVPFVEFEITDTGNLLVSYDITVEV